VNKTQLQGVQLEISISQRRALLEDGVVNENHPFIIAIREGLAEYEKKCLKKENKQWTEANAP
jgi:hypothetical protein